MSDSIFDEFSQEDFGFTAVDEVEYVSKTDTLEKQLEATQSSTEEIQKIQEQVKKIILHQSSLDDLIESNITKIDKKLDVIMNSTSQQIQEILADQGRSMEELSELICKSADDELASKYDKELQNRMKEVENLVIPFLKSLAKDTEKEYVYWPNRKAFLEKKAKDLINITRKK